jgi:putative copper resistance protein D
MIGSHLTPIYNLALEREWVHQVEHVIYLLTALLFWWPAIGVDPGPHRLAHPGRVLYLLLIMPVMAFLGVAIISTGRVLYPYYAAHGPLWGATPLSDQRLAGTLMWISGMLIITPALAVAVLRWLDQDALDQARRETARPPVGTRLADAAVRPADLSFED